jgi:hypothetical protein
MANISQSTALSILKFDDSSGTLIHQTQLGTNSPTGEKDLYQWRDAAGNALASIAYNPAQGSTAYLKIYDTVYTPGFPYGTYFKGTLASINTFGTKVFFDGNNSGSPVSWAFRDAGFNEGLTITNHGLTLTTSSLYTGGLTVLSSNSTYVPLSIKGAASQTADLQQWQNNAGSVMAKVDSSGALTITNTSGASSLITVNGAGGGQFVVTAYGGIITNAGLSSIGASSYFGGYGGTSNVVVNVTGASGQTGDLQRWTNFAGTTLAKVDNLGNFTATSKSFDIIHPTKENMRLRYGSLEGPENGVYIRGTAESNIIELPDYWTGLVHEDSITVSLTSVGSAQNIYVEKIENNKIYIGGNLKKVFFTVYGERKDIDKLTVEY